MSAFEKQRVTTRSLGRTNPLRYCLCQRRGVVFCRVQFLTPPFKAHSCLCPEETRLNQAEVSEQGREVAEAYPQRTVVPARCQRSSSRARGPRDEWAPPEQKGAMAPRPPFFHLTPPGRAALSCRRLAVAGGRAVRGRGCPPAAGHGGAEFHFPSLRSAAGK